MTTEVRTPTPRPPPRGALGRLVGGLDWRHLALSVLCAAVTTLLHQFHLVPLAGTVAPSPLTADPLALPIDYEGVPFDGHGDARALESNGKPWPTSRLTYSIDYASAGAVRPALSRDAISASFRQAWDWWAEGLVIEPAEVADAGSALVRIRFGHIDGPLGVLAESYLADGTLRPKGQLYDVEERWSAGPPATGSVSLPAVAAHEIGHVLGLGHDDPLAAAIMRPAYTAMIPRPQPRDYQRLVVLGYAKRAGPPPGADVLTLPVRVRTADLIDLLRKAGHTVDGRPD